MTEDEWFTSADPLKLLKHFRGSLRQRGRKLRLVAVACCRRIWRLFPDERSRQAVEVAERFADGLADTRGLKAASDIAGAAHREAFERKGKVGSSAKWAAQFSASEQPFFAATRSANFAFVAAGDPVVEVGPEKATQAELIRDIFGNPFRPVAVEPTWLTWNDRTVEKLARTIYDERRFELMPILADALEEAGCGHTDILTHCREPNEHVRGCWVVDLLLGKV